MPRRVDVTLTEPEREVLERWARRPKSAQALALRCRIVLAAAEGRQSKEIAARLHLSIKTVESHVSNVLRKLQLSSRHELTRWAAEQGLG